MRAVICEKPGRMVVKEVARPSPSKGEILIKVKDTAICGSDIKTFKSKQPHSLVTLPLILGHEFSGVVEKVGSGVKGFSVGDRVVVNPSFACGKCYYCRLKRYNLCDNLQQLGHQLAGSFAEYTIANAPFVYRIPKGLSYEEASLTQPLAIGIHAVSRSKIKSGDFVAILGAGAIGQLIVQLCRRKGARVLITDVFDQRLKKAKSLGANFTLRGDERAFREKVLTHTEGKGPDIVFEAAGNILTMRQALETVRKGGSVVLVGLTAHESERIPWLTAVLKELTLVGTIRYVPEDYSRAIDLMSRGAVRVKPIIQRTFLLDETPEVFEDISKSPAGVLRAVMKSENT